MLFPLIGDFYGTFDDAGHTISSLYMDVIQNGRGYIGLFRYVACGTIKNLNVQGEFTVHGQHSTRFGYARAFEVTAEKLNKHKGLSDNSIK